MRRSRSCFVYSTERCGVDENYRHTFGARDDVDVAPLVGLLIVKFIVALGDAGEVAARDR